MIADFYKDFHKKIEETSDNSGKFSGEKFLGIDPISGKNVYVKIGRFGPVAQIGDTISEEKPKFAGLKKEQSIENITLDEVLDLFAFPRILGEYEDSEIQVAIGRFFQWFAKEKVGLFATYIQCSNHLNYLFRL